jgi:carboxyl-terminal processing protease
VIRLSARRTLPALIVAVFVAASALAAPVTVRPAHAAEAGLVFAVVDLLKNEHVDRPDPLRLLAAAVDGLRQALSRAGVTATLPDIVATDEAAARAEFQTRFERAVAAAAGRLTDTQLQHAAAQAMAASMNDSHTGFITPERFAEIEHQRRNLAGFTGIGILLMHRERRFYVRLVFPGTPAERSGLRPFDRIVAIDGQSTEGMGMEDVVNRVRGPRGEAVTITVQRPGLPVPLSITIVREPIVVPAVEHRMKEGQIGYIRFGQFTAGSADMMRRAIEDLQAQGMRGLILDIRSNRGGFVRELNLVAEMFLPAGLPIYTMDSRRDGVRTHTTRGHPLLDPATPLVVLIDDGTASAGELLAAALQEHGRGTLVGTRTAGAVLVSITFPLRDGSALSVSIARMTTSRGVVLEGNGLRPDIEVELTIEDLDRGIDSQLARARDELARRLAHTSRPLEASAAR